MDTILASNEEEVRYVVMVNGQACSPRYTTPQAAEAQLTLLSEEHQSIAEIVAVTVSGDQLLLG